MTLISAPTRLHSRDPALWSITSLGVSIRVGGLSYCAYWRSKVTVQTGLLMSVVAIFDMVFFLAGVSKASVSNTLTSLSFRHVSPLERASPTCVTRFQSPNERFLSSHLLFNTPMNKLYLNTLLSILNSRVGWKYSTSSVTQRNDGLSTFRAEPNFQATGAEAQDTQITKVNILIYWSDCMAQIYLEEFKHKTIDAGDFYWCRVLEMWG